MESFGTAKILWKKVHPDAVLPVMAYELAGAFDFTVVGSIEKCFISCAHGHTIYRLRTGLACEFDSKYLMLIALRSGMAKFGMYIPNSPAIIDPDYRGELQVPLVVPNRYQTKLQEVKRIAQGWLVPRFSYRFEEVQELSPTLRGERGFGSSGQ